MHLLRLVTKGFLVNKDGFHDEVVTVGNKGQRDAEQEDKKAKYEGFSLFKEITRL